MLELFGIPWQEFAISIGSVVGIYSKAYALYDGETVWSRKSSLVNVAFFPPSLLAFYTLGLYLVTFTTFLSFLIWAGIYLYRAPDDEDWLGRTSG